MILSEDLLIRKVVRYIHILNPYSGLLVSLTIKNFENLSKARRREIDEEIFETIEIPKNSHMNSRLFRSSLSFSFFMDTRCVCPANYLCV